MLQVTCRGKPTGGDHVDQVSGTRAKSDDLRRASEVTFVSGLRVVAVETKGCVSLATATETGVLDLM